MRFEGRRVLVTGASRGIGRGIADAFLEEGATVFATDLLEAELRAVVGAHPAADRIVVHAADLADPQAAVGIVPAAVAGLLVARGLGWIDAETLTGDRPATGFITTPRTCGRRPNPTVGSARAQRSRA